MIDIDKKIIFVHIMKTGGTSISEALGYQYNKEITIKNKHLSIKEMINLLGEEEIENYFKFTVVRNPWDRLVSMFIWRTEKKIHKEHYIPPNTTFTNYIENLDKYNINEYKTVQCEYLKDENGIIQIDEIIKFENLSKGYNKLCNLLEVKNPRKLPVLNKTNHKHYSKYYNKKTKNIVKEICKEDIDLFNYKYEDNIDNRFKIC